MMYYDAHVYGISYNRMKRYERDCCDDRAYNVLCALFLERRHENNYVSLLENLVNSSQNIDEKCLLLSVLLVAYLNSDASDKYKCIVNNSDHEYYFEKYKNSNQYVYLLRNVSYYIADFNRANKYYDQCLNAFKNRDPVNYKRTISNYICYLMRHDVDLSGRLLKNRMQEVEEIIKYMDDKYLYLNINYGLYLMKYNLGDPTEYFSSIAYSSETTETPFIYAQINLAAYTVKSNPEKALSIMNCIEYEVQKTTIPRTKQFYNINRCLIDYINGNYREDLIQEIRNSPLRGNHDYGEFLYTYYKKRFDQKIPYSEHDWDKLFLPGYLFYRYFEAELLLAYSMESQI
ncbi:hypothetical protein [Candidatus Bathycorpusculum sp.]|uniref:hypothetical protein n=1 Tax=Candidatus Bathycorpusculum sp. TaxID=2994959 RepID=UPI002831BEBA|nr:hypothetical protein [Candidatus Termitimicrobium sp.]